MASSIRVKRVKFNIRGGRAVERSSGVTADLAARADSIASAANSLTSPDRMDAEPFGARSVPGHAYVHAQTPHGIRSENKNKTLTKSVGAGG